MQQNIIWQLQPQYTQERREAEEPSVDDTHIYICISLITIMWNIESVTGSLVELAEDVSCGDGGANTYHIPLIALRQTARGGSVTSVDIKSR